MKNLLAKTKRIDIAIIVVLPILAAFFTYLFRLNLFITAFLFLGLPGIYLSFRNPSIIKKSLIFSVAGLPFLMAVDYLATIDGSWFIPQSIFGYRIFGVITIDITIWWVLLIYFVIMMYEHFFDFGKKTDRFSKNFKYFLVIILLVGLVFIAFLFTSPYLLHINYFYLKAGIVLMLLPLLGFISYFPKILLKFLKISVYFFGLYLLYELVGLSTGQWTFPGQNFIGFITIFNIRFPYEEFLFWMVFGVSGLLTYYEFFADDRK